MLARSGARRRMAAALLSAPLLIGLAAPSALAAPGKTEPGSNGDVKVHAVGTSFLDEANQPHVCQFDLDAFNFDTVQFVTWSISQQPPTGHALASKGSITLHNGMGTTAVMTLPAGHYKLTWTFKGETGKAKSKVFWSDCAGVASPPPGSTVIGPNGNVIGTVNSAGKIVTSSALAHTGFSLPGYLAAIVGLMVFGFALPRLRLAPRRLRRGNAA